MATTTCELTWLIFSFKDLQIQLRPTSLFCNNQAALCIVANTVYHEGTNYQTRLSCCQKENSRMKDCHQIFLSHLQMKDMFTKILGGDIHKSLISKLNLLDIHTST